MSVPVLSNTTVVIPLMFSRTSPPLIRQPKEAAIPVPTMTAVGVARPKAQGHAITRVDTPKLNANTNLVYPPRYNCSFPKSEYVIENQNIQEMTASSTIVGTKNLAILSATFWMGALAD